MLSVLALTLLIRFFKFKLRHPQELCTFFLRNDLAFQCDIHWFHISLSKYHVYYFPLPMHLNLLVTPCSALVVTHWFLVVISIARSSEKYNLFTLFFYSLKMLLTRKTAMFITTPSGILGSVYLLSDVVSSTFTLIHLLLISSLINYIIHSSLYS